VPRNETTIICAPRVSSSEVARQWLVKFAAICQKEFSAALANIWDEQLRDIEPGLLNRACDSLIKEWDSGFLPVPGNIRKKAESLQLAERTKVDQEKSQRKALLEHQRAIAYAEYKQRLLAAPTGVMLEGKTQKVPAAKLVRRSRNLWCSPEERTRAYAALGQKETDPAIAETSRRQKSALAARFPHVMETAANTRSGKAGTSSPVEIKSANPSGRRG
jgi:hypothetical protein